MMYAAMLLGYDRSPALSNMKSYISSFLFQPLTTFYPPHLSLSFLQNHHLWHGGQVAVGVAGEEPGTR